MPIKKFKDTYRPQRQGKIHLGVKKSKHVEGRGLVEYPHEVNYFVLRDCPELIKIYGPDPEDLRNPDSVHQLLHVTMPSARFDKKLEEYLEKVFPQYYKRYRMSGLFCKGNGDLADCVNEETGTMDEIECPCDYLESGECKQIGIFRFRIQEIPSFNVYQITTSSTNSILNINSFIRDLLEHCYVNNIDPSSVKLELRREPQVVQRLENGKPKKSKHFIMVLDLDRRSYKSLDEVAEKALPAGKEEPKALPAPDETKDDLLYPSPEAMEVAHEEAEKANKEIEEEEAKKAEAKVVKEEEKPETGVDQPSEKSQYESQYDEAMDELNAKIDEFVKLGGNISLETREKHKKFSTFQEASAEIDRLTARIEKKKKSKGKKPHAGDQGEIPF